MSESFWLGDGAVAPPAWVKVLRSGVRYLAIDLGLKRTGIAVGDSVTGIVTPIEVLRVPAAGAAGEELMNAVVGVCVEHLGEVRAFGGGGAKGEIVVGLPLHMDGTEGPGAKAAREFGMRLSERTGRVVRYMDERLSSAQAEWELNGSGLTREQKKNRRDALAAAAILREFLGRGISRKGAEDAEREGTEGGGWKEPRMDSDGRGLEGRD